MAAKDYYTIPRDLLYELLKNTPIQSSGGSGNGSTSTATPVDPECSNTYIDGWDTPSSFCGKAIAPPKISKTVKINQYVKRDILSVLESPAYKKAYTKGHRMVALTYAIKEGYKPGSASYTTKNPGNIGNTDSGARKTFNTIKEGIDYLLSYYKQRADGTAKGWEFGKKEIPPYFSKEINNNPKNYQRPNGQLPGYRGEYNGEIGYFVKRYATFARVNNNGISGLATIFKINGYPSDVNGNTKLSDLLKYDDKTDIKFK